tara:strand:+ start:490 stop:681 length:192 start_codon:yes stop_codon:yes gene_type:complete
MFLFYLLIKNTDSNLFSLKTSYLAKRNKDIKYYLAPPDLYEISRYNNQTVKNETRKNVLPFNI